MCELLLLNVELLIRIIHNDLFPSRNKLLNFRVFPHSFIDSKHINEIILSKFILIKILPRVVQLGIIEVNVFKISLFSENVVDYRAIEEGIHCDTLKQCFAYNLPEQSKTVENVLILVCFFINLVANISCTSR